MNGRVPIGIALFALAVVVAFAARPHEMTASERTDQITAELRCPVCQGLSVKDSSSDTARQMRDLVAERVREGRTNGEIQAELRAAYGDWILLSPPLTSWSGLIWLAPIAAVAAGLVLAAGRLRDGDAPRTAEPSASQIAALRERVAREEAAEG